MIKLSPFRPADFDKLISWIDSPELLIQIAGYYFTYPLTDSQLQNYLDDPKSISFNIEEIASNQVIGHAEIILTGSGFCKLDKVIIGDQSNRGKGYGGLVINELLKYCFERLNANEVELNVFDWNAAAIKCYERSGFAINHDKTQTMEVQGTTWTAFNMTVDKVKWIKLKSNVDKTLVNES